MSGAGSNFALWLVAGLSSWLALLLLIVWCMQRWHAARATIQGMSAPLRTADGAAIAAQTRQLAQTIRADRPMGTAGSNIAHFTPTAEAMRTIRAQAFRAAGDGLAQTANPYRPDSRRGVIWLTFFFEARMAQEWAAEAAQPPQHEQAGA